MSRKKELVPFSGVRVDYEASLQEYMLAAGGMAAAIDTVLTIAERLDKSIPDAFKEPLQEALARFEAIR
jgi:hypothetical protein